MSASSFDPNALLAESRLGVLATIKADGSPQLSPVMPFSRHRRAGEVGGVAVAVARLPVWR